MAYDVKVTIDLAKPTGSIGFGIPLVLQEHKTGGDVEYAEVSSLAEVITAGFNTTSHVYKAAQLIFMQDNAPKTIAVAATGVAAATTLGEDVSLVHHNWRQLVVVNESETPTKADDIANQVEALEGKMYFTSANEEALEGTLAGLVTKNYRRTVVLFAEDQQYPEAALVGATAGRAVGSFTYKNLILKGVSSMGETTNEALAALKTLGVITVITRAGDIVTSEGIVASGEYIDIIDSEDYIIQQLAYKTQKLLNNAPKIPMDNNGIAMLESVAVDVLQTAYNNGMIATTADGQPDYSINYDLVEEVTEDDRANRIYRGGNFRFRLAGAVHEVEIVGEIKA